MLNALNTKLLLVIVALLASIASYLGYEKHRQQADEQKAQQMFQRMQTEGKQALPSGWGTALKKS